MSWRQWAQGEIVEAGDLQDLVQNQVIQSYETETQRDNTLGANVIEGMFCYIEETGNFQLYDGFDWVTLNTGGDITGVAAGDGLTGGGTTGDVTLAADMTFINANASITASQISDVTSTAAELNILDGVTSTAAEINILDGITATTAELNFTDGVTSDIQTQLNDKQQDVITTEGDLVTGDVNGDPVRVAIGTADQVLTSNGTALTWADASGGTSTGGLNYIINGAFDFWQRGDSFSNPAQLSYSADRWQITRNGTGGTRTITQQTFSPGELATAGFGDAQFYLRFADSVAPSGQTFNVLRQVVEDVRTLAGQSVSLSFYAQAASEITIGAFLGQRFGTGGSARVLTTLSDSITVGTSWQRYIFTGTLPSVSGKTIGPNSILEVEFGLPINSTFEFEIWGVQLEAGSTATPFKRNANSIQGELAACQRYYHRIESDGGLHIAVGYNGSSTAARFPLQTPVTMRATPSFAFEDLIIFYNGFTSNTPSSIVIQGYLGNIAELRATASSSVLTASSANVLNTLTNFGGFLELDSEL